MIEIVNYFLWRHSLERLWCLCAALCNSRRHLRAAAAEIETLCSPFAGCISLTFINLLPSITANETPAQCLPLGHRQLQLAIIQRRSWIKDKWFCHLSVAAIDQAVMPGTYCGRSGAVLNYCRLLNYPRLWERCEASLPVLGHTAPAAAPVVAVVFLGELKELQRAINSVLPPAERVVVYGRAEPERGTATTSTLKLMLSWEQTLYDLAQSKTRHEPSRQLDTGALIFSSICLFPS